MVELRNFCLTYRFYHSCFSAKSFYWQGILEDVNGDYPLIVLPDINDASHFLTNLCNTTIGF